MTAAPEPAPGEWPPPVQPPMPAPSDAPPTARQLLRYYRTNALAAWPASAYQDDWQERTMFGRRGVLINTPDDIRRVLIDNDDNYGRTRPTIRILRPLLGDGLFLAGGETWKHHRRTLAPAFSPKATPAFAAATAEALAAALPVLHARTGADVDLFAWLQHLTLDVAGQAMFSLPMRGLSAAMRRPIAFYGERYGRPGFLDFVLPVWLPNPRDVGRALFRRRWFRLIDRLVAERRALPPEPGRRDVFDLLCEARDPETRAPCSDRELKEQVATLIVAGHETTAVALFWCCYLLALAPAWQERLAAEAEALDPDAEPAAAVPRFVLGRAVFQEALRLYPPAFIIVRLARGPDRLAGRKIAPGTVVMAAPWVLHRHERLWQRPNAFNPTRFLPDAPPPPRFAYLPFGAGPRVCIGASLAMTEAVLVLAALARRFRIRLADDRPVLPVAVVTTQPDHAPPFRLDPR